MDSHGRDHLSRYRGKQPVRAKLSEFINKANGKGGISGISVSSFRHSNQKNLLHLEGLWEDLLDFNWSGDRRPLAQFESGHSPFMSNAGHVVQLLLVVRTSLLDHFVEVSLCVLQQLEGLVEFHHPTSSHDEDFVHVDDRVESMCNGENCAVGEVVPDGLLNRFIRLLVHVGSCFVHHKDGVFLQKRPGQTEQLSLYFPPITQYFICNLRSANKSDEFRPTILSPRAIKRHICCVVMDKVCLILLNPRHPCSLLKRQSHTFDSSGLSPLEEGRLESLQSV